jgi:hypothetical protein
MEKYSYNGTTEITLRDGNGNIKPLWSENRLGKFVRRTFGIDLQGWTGLGTWVDCLCQSNTITNVGHAAANGKLSNQGGYSTFTALAIGTGTQGTPATSTALAAEISTNGGARGTAGTISQVTTTVTNDTTSLVKTWTFSGGFSITEEGIFDNASSGGNMLAYQSFSTVSVVSTDQLTVTHKYQT